MTRSVPLSSVIKVHYGKALKSNERDSKGSIPVYGSSGCIGFHSQGIISFPTLIIGRKGSVGSVTYAPTGGWPIDTCFYTEMINPTEADLRYLFFALKYADLAKWTITTSIPGLSRDAIYATHIALPSLIQQQRIAETLDKIDALIEKRRCGIKRVDTFFQNLFLDVFGDPAINPKGWKTQPLEEIADKFSDGPFGSNLKTEHYVETGVRVIRLQNIGLGRFLDNDKAFISEEHFRSLPKHHCRAGDIVIGTMGDPNLRACMLPTSVQSALNKADCVLLRPNQNLVVPEYICWLLNMPSTLKMAQSLILGQTRLRISMGRLKTLVVPVPPLELQKSFAIRVRRLESLRHNMSKSEGLLQELFRSTELTAFADWQDSSIESGLLANV